MSNGLLQRKAASAPAAPSQASKIAKCPRLSERGISTAPFFLRNVDGSVFLDCGVAAVSLLPGLEDLEQTRVGAGAELGLDLVLFHILPMTVRAGYARGLLPEPDGQFYLGFESSVLGEILSSGLDPNRAIITPRTHSPLPN